MKANNILAMVKVSADFSELAMDQQELICARDILCRVGDKWSLYVVRSLRGKPMRFNELKRSIAGISQRMLTLTLRGLERDGLATRTVYSTKPPRVDYELTQVGHTLVEPVMALLSWAERNRVYIHYSCRRFDERGSVQRVFELRR
jgi:DNA-binding HxlR family transcriptional regulator